MEVRAQVDAMLSIKGIHTHSILVIKKLCLSSTQDDRLSSLFSSPQEYQSAQHAILVQVFHPSYGFIVRIHHFLMDCESDNESASTNSCILIRQPHSMRTLVSAHSDIFG
jgi:hypothetical protein